MGYELTLAEKDSAEIIARSSGCSGAFYVLGADADRELRQHPLAKAELGKPRKFDHVHLSIPDGTDLIRWMGRAADGFHYQIGRTMRLIKR